MRVDQFDFDLPESAIALRPAEPRGSGRMLHVESDGALRDRRVADLPDLLRPGDIVVRNNTRVIPARLRGTRVRGDARAKIEVLLHQRAGPASWRAFLRPAKKVRVGERIGFGSTSAQLVGMGDGGDGLLDFDLSGPELDNVIAVVGELPLPPYIEGKRSTDARDEVDYQTSFATEDGAVAAPTAGLHWTDELEGRLHDRNVEIVSLTLHVGAGTFLPVKVADTSDHRMHAEWGQITARVAEQINRAKAKGGRVIAVGTTSLRLLETAAQEDGTVRDWSGPTDIFITPGFRFGATDLLMTNFHLPRSTLFMLVSAFSGLTTMKRAYAHAIDRGYRFYSYGDASLLERTS